MKTEGKKERWRDGKWKKSKGKINDQRARRKDREITENREKRRGEKERDRDMENK